MVVLLTCKNEEDPIKNRGARVFTTLYIKFSDVQGQITLMFVVVSSRNSNSSKLSCMPSLPARLRLIKSKMKELECSQSFSHYKSVGFFQTLKGSYLRSPWSDLAEFRSRSRCYGCPLSYQYEEDPIKNRGARVFTTLFINFSDAQGQKTLELVVLSGRNLNSSKLSCMSLLPARMRMIDSKMKELKCSQDFSHYKSMGFFQTLKGS